MYILTTFRFRIQVDTTNYLINLRNVTSVYKSNILTAYPASNIFPTSSGFPVKTLYKPFKTC